MRRGIGSERDTHRPGHEPPGTAPGRCCKTIQPKDGRRRLHWVCLVDDESGDVLRDYPLHVLVHVLEGCPEPDPGEGK